MSVNEISLGREEVPERNAFVVTVWQGRFGSIIEGNVKELISQIYND